jgi:hypothetical protein
MSRRLQAQATPLQPLNSKSASPKLRSAQEDSCAQPACGAGLATAAHSREQALISPLHFVQP